MTTRVRNYGGFEIPSATRTLAISCGDPECEHAHLIGFDEQNVPFCEIVLSEDILLKAYSIIEWNRKK